MFILHHPERAFDNDSKGYLHLAEALVDSHTFPSILRTPGYPFFIALIYCLFGKYPQAVLFFQYLLDSATAVLVALLFFRIFQNVRYSFIAGFLYGINPFTVFYSSMILGETLFTFILASVTLLFAIFLRTEQKMHLIASSVLMGVSILCKPIALYVPFLMSACILLSGHKPRARVISALIFIMVSYTILVPWYIKNYSEHGRWTLSTIDDLNFVVSFAPEVLMLKDDPLSVATVNINEKIGHFRKVLQLEVEKRYGRRAEDLIEPGNGHPSQLITEARRIVYENPVVFIASHLVNIGRVLCPYHPRLEKITGGSDSKVITFIAAGTDIVIMGFFATGIVISLKRSVSQPDRAIIVMMIILIAYFSFVPGVVGYARFRMPILPYISIFSSLGLAGLAALRGRERGRT